MMAFAMRELNSRPSIGLPFQTRPSLMSLPLMRKRSPAMETTVWVSGMVLAAVFNISPQHSAEPCRLQLNQSIVGKRVLRAVQNFLDEAQEGRFHRPAVDAVGRGFQHVAIGAVVTDAER